MLKPTKKIFSHYIINQPCLNNCDQCKNPEQIHEKNPNLELFDLKSKLTLKCKNHHIKKQKHTIFFHKPPLTYPKNVN
jgi:hypothetical protein